MGKQCTVSKLKCIAALGGASILLGSFAVSGKAFIKKEKCHFEAAVSFTWEVLDPFGGFLGATGTGQVVGFTQEQSSAKVTIKASPAGSAKAKAAGDWMKQKGAALISESLNGEEI